MRNLLRLWNHISRDSQRKIGLLTILILFTSIAEIMSFGAVLPFLGILNDSLKIKDTFIGRILIEVFHINNFEYLLISVTVIFIFTTLIAGCFRLLLLWASIRLAFSTSAELGGDIYKKTLCQPYIIHTQRSSSEIISGITNKTGSLIFDVTMPCINIVGSSVILFSVISILIAINPFVTLIAISGFGIIYGLIAYMTKKHLELNSMVVAKEQTNVLKSLQEGLGGIRDILLDGSQDIFCQIYKNAEIKLYKANAENSFTSAGPRIAVEAIGIAFISFFAFFLSRKPLAGESIFPLLGTLALGAQRMLPILQLIFYSWTRIKNSEVILSEVLDLLDQPLPQHAKYPSAYKIEFKNRIILQNVFFRYNVDSPYILKKIDLEINKGSRIGFVGTTGSGKSTLLDIIMGLLEPTSGMLIVDDKVIDQKSIRAWQAKIAHVPQNIFLSDSTITENIAFGVPYDKINFEAVKNAARKAQINDDILSLKKEYNELVGERGVRLSGGQKQRIGIARALYKNASILIFDEATSSLDNETEKKVMNAINSLGKDLTILMIAHRLSTVKNCDKIIELKQGEIVKIGSYHDLFNG